MSKKKRERTDPASLGLPLAGVDSHAHLDMAAFAEDLGQVLDRARAAGLAGIGNVFLGPWAYEAGQDLFRDHDEVFFLMGIHPHDVLKCTDEAVARMEDILRQDDRVRALGEIGLDFYRDWSPFETQRQAFKRQLELARDLGLRTVIHSRDADGEIMAGLLDMGFKDRPVLWHCFGGSPDLAQDILSHGWTISIPGTVTYAGNTALHQAVSVIPLDRMVLETDCPYLTPEPWRGRRNEPALSVFTAGRIAELKGVDIGEVWRATGRTARVFFGLDEEPS